LIRVGSDCSGIGTEVLALESIGALADRTAHVFASEKDPAVRKILTHNHPRIQTVYEDVTQRRTATTPATDLYFNTSPCTTFSTMGKQELPLVLHA
jgi:site-specific DNA-cytosine methylase